ncbi:MAG TPA: PspC domain-containing protein [Granulicella sp.]
MFCSQCGSTMASSARYCSMCGVPRTSYVAQEDAWRGSGPLVRPRERRMVAGVCAGLSQAYGWDLGVVRLVTVALILLTGVAFFVYLAAWIILPEGQYALPAPPPPPPAASPTESPSI